MPASELALPLRIGARTVLTLRRRVRRTGLTLADALAGNAPVLPPIGADEHGHLVTAPPAAALPALARAHPALRPFVRQRYRRCYVALEQDFDAYFAAFSGKSRATLRRKERKLAERGGGAIDVRCYRGEDEVETFYTAARAVSARTYQERLLQAGLPAGDAALADMRALARHDRARGWLLFLDGAPIAYLWAPAEGATLIYAYLGYDPAHAELSPGTVLQLAALRDLMAERRFRWFDFTEGEGQHKSQFATGAIDCLDVLLLRRSAGNLATGHALNGFDGAVAMVKRAAGALGLNSALRRLRRPG